ncbi:MAG: hypothetical protein SOT07_06580 [Paludibacteraceae bacterium]|nr:hypothetical protein [Paludibacteraceae bacterium]
MEFFGCAWGKGVSLPTTEGDGVFWLQGGRGCLSTYHRGGWSFLVAGVAKVSFYLPPRGMEFFGCGRGEGVSLPTTEGMGVFWLREGQGCLSTYHRGGWSFLVAGGARVSLYLPPRGMEFFGCRQGEGVSLPTTEGQEQKNAHPQAGWAVVGYCGRIIGVQRILYARIWMVRQIALTLSRIIRHIRIIRLAILVSAESAL